MDAQSAPPTGILLVSTEKSPNESVHEYESVLEM